MKHFFTSIALSMMSIIGTGLADAADPRRPNIVFIIADDLGYGDLGCYGQTKFKTPAIDTLAARGVRLPVHYAGNNVCAPSRCVLMTGLHPGHTFIRDNRQAKGFDEGQTPVPPDTLALPLTLKKLGYATGAFGKWGMGPVGSTGDPAKQGIDQFYGYNCQAQAHNYYPTHLWDNDKQFAIDNPKFAPRFKLPADADLKSPATYAPFSGKHYAPDLIHAQAMKFIEQNKDKPFFLFYPTTVPHLALQVPADSVKEFEGKFDETPYAGGNGYLPHPTPRAAYAGMIQRMDANVGQIMALITKLNLDNDTIFIFTSDNGPLYDKLGGTDADFFKSAGAFKGRKGSMYEGGVRVPCIISWKGHLPAGKQFDRITGFEDWLPTLLDLIGAKSSTPAGIDGISFAPTLMGAEQPPRPFLYRESPGYTGQQSVRVNQFKAVRQRLNPGPRAAYNPGALELYDLEKDPGETTNIAAAHPEKVKELSAIMAREHIKSDLFPIKALDDPQ